LMPHHLLSQPLAVVLSHARMFKVLPRNTSEILQVSRLPASIKAAVQFALLKRAERARIRQSHEGLEDVLSTSARVAVEEHHAALQFDEDRTSVGYFVADHPLPEQALGCLGKEVGAEDAERVALEGLDQG